jgi:hypothetical protein
LFPSAASISDGSFDIIQQGTAIGDRLLADGAPRECTGANRVFGISVKALNRRGLLIYVHRRVKGAIFDAI